MNLIVDFKVIVSTKPADVLKLGQPKVSLITNLKTKGFSLEKVFKLVSMLNYEVEITVRKTNLN